MKQAFLFDLDGTISDSVPMILANMREALDELGIEADDQTLLLTIGRPLLEAGEDLLGPGGGQTLLEYYLRRYDQTKAQRPLLPFPGMPELISELRQQGAALALVTAKRRQVGLASLAELGLEDSFDLVLCAEDTVRHKPDPEPVLLALERLHIPAERACFVGDSVHDLRSGQGAGCAVAAVAWGAGSKEQLQELGPDFLAETVSELRQYLLSRL